MNEEKIIQKLLDHDQKFDEFSDKMDENFSKLHDEMLTGFDQILTIVKRLDQERVFTFEIVKRLQKDIDKIKRVLKMS